MKFAVPFLRRSLRLALGATLALCAVGALSRPAVAGDKKPAAPTDVVYVESNIGTPGGNSIFAFHRDAAGNLTMLPGSPFPTGGRGVFDLSLALGPFDSDQNLVINPEKTLLFAVNSGSNTIAVFDIHADGSLTPVKGSPFPSGGINPVSVGLSGSILVVVNKNEDPAQLPNDALPNYTTFRVNPNGKLIAVPHSTISVPQGASPTQALTSPLGPYVFGADFLGGLLQSFVVLPNGRLWQHEPQPLPASEFPDPATPRLPLGLQIHPTLPILYVGFVTDNRLGVYIYDIFGGLHFVRSVPNSGAAICWLYANKAGTRLYTSNTGDNSVSVYDITRPLHPVEIQKVTLKGDGNPLQLTLDPTERFLYVVSQRATPTTPLGSGSYLRVLEVAADGTLTEVPSSPTTLPVPPGTRPQGVAAL